MYNRNGNAKNKERLKLIISKNFVIKGLQFLQVNKYIFKYVIG